MFGFRLWLEGEVEEGVYEVPADRMELINKQLGKVNKRAAKLGLPPVRLVELGRSAKTAVSPDGSKRSREYVKLRVEGEAPKVKGWTFVARIMHSEGGNIISSAPGMEPPPAEYRTAEPHCDHCRVNRRRNDTFVLRDEKGEYKQIGRNCLADFLGSTDPADQIALFSDWNSVVQSLGGDDDDSYGGGGGRSSIEIVSYLTGALAVIRRYGFVPKSKSEEWGKQATSSVLDTYFFGTGKAANELRAEVAAVSKPDDGDRARDILGWAKDQKNQPDVSDYLWNISAAAERLLVDIRTAGLVASMPAAYERAVGGKMDKERAEKASDDAPEVTLKPKDKFEGVLTVLKTPRWSNDYGLTVLHIMEDEHGRFYKWKASNEDIPVGSKVQIKGTVKAVGPDSYAGGKVTVELTRCKVVKMHMGKEHQSVVDQKGRLLEEWESILGAGMPAVDAAGRPVGQQMVRNYVFSKLLERRIAEAGVNYPDWRVSVQVADRTFFSTDENFESPAGAEAMIRDFDEKKRLMGSAKKNPDPDTAKMLDDYIAGLDDAVRGLRVFIELIPAEKRLREIMKGLEEIYKVESGYSGRTVHRESFLYWLSKRCE